MFIQNIASQINTLAFSLSELFGLPENYRANGDQVGHMIEVINWFSLVLFIGWTAFFLFCLVRFRKSKNPKASYSGVESHLSTHLEVGVIIVEAALLFGFALPMWSERTDTFTQVLKENPVKVRAIGYQFGWKFHYAGNDNKFGYIDRSLAKSLGDSCLDPTSLNGRDDYVSTDLILPVGRPIILQLTSTDVIHNFSIIPMRIQQDAIPGKDVPMWFTAKSEMTTSVVCGQLCGDGHARMVGKMTIVSQEEFQTKNKKQSDRAAVAWDKANDAKKVAKK